MPDQFTLWGDTVEVQANEDVGSLNERFIVPPFSLLDTRQGYWQERKKIWLALGIKGELGRDAEISGGSPLFRGEMEYKRMNVSGTSIFCPVLCEIIYRWFCPPGGEILDPFAGGSVRGIVAGRLGYQYSGIDLSDRQIQANYEQADEIKPSIRPRWFVGDARDMLALSLVNQDLIFTCPPYYDLEVYGDDPRDLSLAPTYRHFLEGYRDIISKALSVLRNDRFACITVGEIRDERGLYRNFVGDTITAFMDAGAAFYNEAILVTAIGSLPIRAGKQFQSGRKLGKTHQNVLVFVKGDWKRAAKACGTMTGSFEAMGAEQ